MQRKTRSIRRIPIRRSGLNGHPAKDGCRDQRLEDYFPYKGFIMQAGERHNFYGGISQNGSIRYIEQFLPYVRARGFKLLNTSEKCCN